MVIFIIGLVVQWFIPKSDSLIVVENPLVNDQARHPVDLKMISLTPLFGEYKNEASDVFKSPVSLSRLSVKLLGTVVSSGKSAAVISIDGDSQQHLFFVGDTIKQNVTLESVNANHIVIVNNQMRERVEIESSKDIGSFTGLSSMPEAANGTLLGNGLQRGLGNGLQRSLGN